MENALKNIARLFDLEVADYWQQRFRPIQSLPGMTAKLVRIAAAAGQKELEDLLAEVQFALFFAGLGYKVELNPLGKTGPDLKLSLHDQRPFYIEVIRLQQIYPPAVLAEASADGKETWQAEASYHELLDKFEHVNDGESLLAFWNSDHAITAAQAAFVLTRLDREAAKYHVALPEGTKFVLYGANWISLGNQELHCIPLGGGSTKPARHGG